MEFQLFAIFYSYSVVFVITALSNNRNIVNAASCIQSFDDKKLSQSTFKTPNYPNPYPANSKCTYRFIKSTKEWLIINFKEFDLYNENDPSGQVKNSSFISYISKGNYSSVDSYITNPPILCTKEQKVSVEFNGKYNPSKNKGFSANFEFKENYCTEVFHSKEVKSGDFNSPACDYTDSSFCSYTFVGEPGERVEIVFNHFDLYQPRTELKNGDECANEDSIITYKLYGTTVTVCGDTNPLPIMSDIFTKRNNNFTFYFIAKSKAHHEDTKGFNGSFLFTHEFGAAGSCFFEYNSSTQSSGIVVSPNHPGYYPKNIECYYNFHNNMNETLFLALNFTVFNLLTDNTTTCSPSLTNDFVSISTELNDPSNGKHYCGSQEPFVLYSNNSYNQIVFASKGNKHNAGQLKDKFGFNVTYEFRSNIPSDPNFARKSDCIVLLPILSYSALYIFYVGYRS